MNKLFLICVLLCGTGGCYHYTDEPNIRVIPGVELCQSACDKLVSLDVEHGDKDCEPYYSDVVVDNKTYTCVDFCVYEMSNNVDLKTQCIINNVEVCSIDMSAKCGL